MSSADSDYEDDDNLPSSSDEDPTRASRSVSRPTSRHASHPPQSPRKRRRSESAKSLPDPKRKPYARYNDAYRGLFNETVTGATTRFAPDEQYRNFQTQIGASHWSAREKALFFAALEKLGKDDAPGIAGAIGTKSIPEVRVYLLLLQAASERHGDLKMTLHDVPAALEIGIDCESSLESAADALAWRQERYEAKQEQNRFGKYWLITPQIAEEIEDALNPSTPAMASSPPPGRDNEGSDGGIMQLPQILQDIPEARLLQPTTMLALSANLFMNRSPDIPSPWSHWSEYVSELASDPSMYRTAFNDFHTLVLSLTRRVVQVALIQATSRLRSRRHKNAKGTKPFVKPRDVFSALNILGLKSNGRERWRGVARRCGVRVLDARRRGKREVPWEEVEQIMGTIELSTEALHAHTATVALTSDGESDAFRSRAMRSGTPLPERIEIPDEISESESEEDSDSQLERHDSEEDRDSVRTPGHSSSATETEPQFDTKTIESFDRDASHQEEERLWQLLGLTPPMKNDALKSDEESELRETKRLFQGIDDWRKWTEYRPEWLEIDSPVSLQKFLANRNYSQRAATLAVGTHDSSSVSDDGIIRSPDTASRQKKRKTPANVELPIRGTLAYADYQSRLARSGDQSSVSDENDHSQLQVLSVEGQGSERDEAGDDLRHPVPSVEDVSEHEPSESEFDDEMGFDDWCKMVDIRMATNR